MRYFRRGKSRAIWCPTVSNPAAPTAAEIAAGTDITIPITSIAGWTTDIARFNEPSMGRTQNPQGSGEETFGDATMNLHEGNGVAGTDETQLAAARAALVEGSTGYMVLVPYAAAGAIPATTKCEVWTSEVGSNNRDWDLGNVFAKYVVSFANQNVVKNAVVAA
jgi:hypothetical protein